MAPANPQFLRLPLGGALTVPFIEAAHVALRDALAQGGSVVIDCAGAEAVDLSLVQLLVAARHSAGDRVRLAGPLPAPLQDALRRGGFLAAGAADLAFWQPDSEPA